MHNLFAHPKSAQRGAALIVGLLLLVVLSLLAISGMNSASLEFIMAGNEQYKQNAFQAAETGIQNAVNSATYSTNVPVNTVVSTQPTTTISGTNGDTYAYQVVYVAENDITAGNGIGAASDLYFEIVSTGNSARNASTVNMQGVAIEVPYNQIYQ